MFRAANRKMTAATVALAGRPLAIIAIMRLEVRSGLISRVSLVRIRYIYKEALGRLRIFLLRGYLILLSYPLLLVIGLREYNLRKEI
jgi:hypothetical protein